MANHYKICVSSQSCRRYEPNSYSDAQHGGKLVDDLSTRRVFKMRYSHPVEPRLDMILILTGSCRDEEQHDPQVVHRQAGELYSIKFFGIIGLF